MPSQMTHWIDIVFENRKYTRRQAREHSTVYSISNLLQTCSGKLVLGRILLWVAFKFWKVTSEDVPHLHFFEHFCSIRFDSLAPIPC